MQGGKLGHSPEPVSIRKMIKESLRLVSLSHKGKQIAFINECPKQLVIKADNQKLLQLLVIVLSNACDASEEGASVFIKAKDLGDNIELKIIDSGKGIDDKYISKIFDPFYTTKQAGEGTGLGLSLAYNIIQEHSGNIEVNSQPGQGTEIIIQLPKTS